MGATTWFYPKERVTMEEILTCVELLRTAILDSYTVYLEKSNGFSTPVTIGAQWPKDGMYLPDANTFKAEFTARSSKSSMTTLLESLDTP